MPRRKLGTVAIMARSAVFCARSSGSVGFLVAGISRVTECPLLKTHFSSLLGQAAPRSRNAGNPPRRPRSASAIRKRRGKAWAERSQPGSPAKFPIRPRGTFRNRKLNHFG